MIDWHCHLLPGVDDGPQTVEESVEMARILAAAGFTEVYCTPHCIKGAFDNTPQNVRHAVGELQKAVKQADIALTLQPGMEYYMDEYFAEQLDDPQPLGETNLLLVESPFQASPDLVKENIFQVVRRGYTPLFAHPERYPFLSPGNATGSFWARFGKALGLLRRTTDDGQRMGHRSWFTNSSCLTPHSLLVCLGEMGCFFQGNIPSFSGYYGRIVKDQANRYLKEGIYSYIGTDGHNAHTLQKILGRGLRKLRQLTSGFSP